VCHRGGRVQPWSSFLSDSDFGGERAGSFFFFLDRMKASGGGMLKMSKLW